MGKIMLNGIEYGGGGGSGGPVTIPEGTAMFRTLEETRYFSTIRKEEDLGNGMAILALKEKPVDFLFGKSIILIFDYYFTDPDYPNHPIQGLSFRQANIIFIPYENYTSTNLCLYSYMENSLWIEISLSDSIIFFMRKTGTVKNIQIQLKNGYIIEKI